MFALEKYNTKGSRHECPGCGHKNVFSRYVDEAGNHLALEVGRCNRESKCGYHLTPKEYFTTQNTVTWEPRQKLTPKPQLKPLKLSEIPGRYLEQSVANVERNAFTRFLLSQYDNRQVLQTCERYFIGDFEDFTTFWRIDEQGHINTAKLIRYDAITGKRIKAVEPSWIHAKLKYLRELPDDFNYRRSLFGQHLLQHNTSTVAIVEAEKTAVIASLELPEYVWLACGGRNQLKSSSCDFQALGNRRVILFPDGDSFDEWSKLAQDARAEGLDIIVSDLLDTELTEAQKADGWDLADYLLAPEPTESFEKPAEVQIQSTISSSDGSSALKIKLFPEAEKHEKVETHSYAALFADHCKLCGDNLQPDGSCNLCKEPKSF